MKRFLQWLLALQVVGMFIAATVATVEIESILVSGPILGGMGLVIAALSFRGDFELGFYYGLAVLGVAVLCFSMIHGLRWGPGEAAAPIASLLFVSSIGSAPLGLLAYKEVRQSAWRQRAVRPPFGLSALMLLVFLVSIGFGLSRAAGSAGAACSVFFGYLVAVSCASVSFHGRQSWRRWRLGQTAKS